MDQLTPDDAARLAELTAKLARLDAARVALDPEDRSSMDAPIEKCRREIAALTGGPPAAPDTTGEINISGGRIDGSVVGVNQGVIVSFYGAAPPPNAKKLLDSYLQSLLKQHGKLRLGKLLADERDSRGENKAPAMALGNVYTAMATNATVRLAAFTLPQDDVLNQLDKGDPDAVLPAAVRFATLHPRDGSNMLDRAATVEATLAQRWAASRAAVEQAGNDLAGVWFRPELAVEAVANEPLLVLLGSPGSGKSTVLRYLVVALAEALLAGRARGLHEQGWQARPLPVPIFCPLGLVAQKLADQADAEADYTVLEDALLASVTGRAIHADLRPTLLEAWRNGGALLLLDGLDEVPGTRNSARNDTQSRRERMAAAIRTLATLVGETHIVVTCRTKPYEEAKVWQLRDEWAERRLEPFTRGQVGYFVAAWYREACAQPGAKYPPDQADDRVRELNKALSTRPKLLEITASPLLLTMLLLLHYNKAKLPQERADVYEALVALLLERWDDIRTADRGARQSLAERLHLPGVVADDLRPAIHQLAFEAHRQEIDGRGVLPHDLVCGLFDEFFARKVDPTDWQRIKRERVQVVDKTNELIRLLTEEAGLIQAEDDETYILPHLTFQEYLAACQLAARFKGLDVYELWRAGGDRWREPLLLLMRRLITQEKGDLALSWLRRLTPQCAADTALSAQQQRDVLLAAACYDELGRATFVAELGEDAAEYEARLRAALRSILEHPAPTITQAQRVDAGVALGTVGDPRFPVTLDDWRAELARRAEQFGDADGYWRYIRPGMYRIGGWAEDEPSAELDLPPFWVARFPLTVAQYAPFVDVGYSAEAERWWTPAGRQWKTKEQRSAPLYWNRERYNVPNQPVIGVTWYEATAFAAWLTEQLGDRLPPDYVVRLPTEAEWEAAAAYDHAGQRRPYPWSDEPPTTEHAVFAAAEGQGVNQPAPVGCCAAGAAACGALDMAGNVWEWTASSHTQYPAGSQTIRKEFTTGEYDVPLRGGAYYSDSTGVRCGARNWDDPIFDIISYGFRIVVAPRLAGSS